LINYLAEILTSTLVGTGIFADMRPEGYGPDHGGLFISIDISTFTKSEIFKNDTERINSITRAQKPKAGIDKLRIPGDRSYEKIDTSLDSGTLEMDESDFEKLTKLSKK